MCIWAVNFIENRAQHDINQSTSCLGVFRKISIIFALVEMYKFEEQAFPPGTSVIKIKKCVVPCAAATIHIRACIVLSVN